MVWRSNRAPALSTSHATTGKKSEQVSLMPSSVCRFIKQVAEFLPRQDADAVPTNTRGIYALLMKRGRKNFDVVYIGCSAAKVSGIHSRLMSHGRSKRRQWSHFSVFE